MAPSRPDLSSKSDIAGKQRKPRPISLYDVVAGRVGYNGFLTNPQPSRHRDTSSTTSIAVPPEEVLFRRKGAPARFEEDDIYFANRSLHNEQKLPNSELLKTIHAYASDYYRHSTRAEDDQSDTQSLDETALLAIGILLEEAAKHALGTTGYLAFLEPTANLEHAAASKQAHTEVDP